MRRAASQFGAIRTDQLSACGLSKDQLAVMVRDGLLQRRLRGIYVSPTVPADHRQAAMVAVLRAPDGAVASHETALFAHGLGPAPSQVHLTVDPRHRVRAENVVAHRSPMPPNHRASIGPLPVTTLARTIVDLASVSDLDWLAAVVDPLIDDGRVDPGRLLRTLDDIVVAPGRHGTTLLRSALEVWIGPIKPGSPAEARLLRLLRERGYHGFEAQVGVEVGGRRYSIDVGWPDEHVGLEYAGRIPHGPRRWSRDEGRAADLEAEGWTMREVDAAAIAPGRTELWTWLDGHLRHRAA
ncbi:MAG TPA: type IV toxin-antitoxin system AbiEi family antitoxin domain-containing protein [Acidimicrobiales bacterium]|nr:type IV toxin-antitoxin system AbiEi family antitoxin domain-containing protein [Acidimicrobiales bacterium]